MRREVTSEMELLRYALSLCREERGQSTVEYALVAIAFLSMVLALGALWHAGRDGLLLRRAVDAASHGLGGGGMLGALRDVALF